MKHAGILVDRLKLMFDWYKGMVDQRTGWLLGLHQLGAKVSVTERIQ
jgi:hypothetical protein